MEHGRLMARGKSKSKRRIAVVTGSRAEYGLLTSTMQAIRSRDDLRLSVVVTGMHLLRSFGYTIKHIIRDGWAIDAKVRMQAGNDQPLDQAEGLSRGVAGIAKFLVEGGIDMVVVLGDRVEAMAGALAGVTTGCVVAHIHGGDVALGDFDDSFRHAITKLAHVHFAATQSAQRRIVRLGERCDWVHFVGAPGLDRLREIVFGDKPRSRKTGQALIVQHASGRSPAKERDAMQRILRVAADAGLARKIIYPNTDRGHTGVVDAIEQHKQKATNGDVRVYRSLDRDRYLRMLIESDVLIGNSSSGIIEAATAGTAVLNVGRRQIGRERAGNCVVDAEESAESIRMGLKRALRKRPIIGASTAYGQRPVGPEIASLLAQTPQDADFRHKLNSF